MPVATVTNLNVPLLEWLQQEYGGSISRLWGTTPRHWAIYSAQAAEFCEGILPWLRVKRQQAEVLIAYYEAIQFTPRGRGTGGDYRRVPPDELERRARLWEQMRTLNEGGRGHIRARIPAATTERDGTQNG